MTARQEVWIECDGCDLPFGREGGYRTPWYVVADARTRGWIVRAGKHFCPDCKDKP